MTKTTEIPENWQKALEEKIDAMRVACDNTCPLPTGAETVRGGMHRTVFGGKPRTFDVEVQAVTGIPVKMRKSKTRGDFAPHA